MKGRLTFSVLRQRRFGESFQICSTWKFVVVIAQQKLKEFNEKKPHLIPLCLVGVSHSNLVCVKERPDLHAIAVNKGRNSHSFKIKKLNLFTEQR